MLVEVTANCCGPRFQVKTIFRHSLPPLLHASILILPSDCAARLRANLQMSSKSGWDIYHLENSLVAYGGQADLSGSSPAFMSSPTKSWAFLYAAANA